jgi:hypothetical protein
MTNNAVTKKRLILGLIYIAISTPVVAFEFPWSLKEYKTYNECMNASPKTLQHKEFLDDTCTRFFFGKPLSEETRKFLLCTRGQVLKTDTVTNARKAIFDCASSYPPKKKETALNFATYYFPTPEELSERRAAEAQDREISRKQDALRQQLMQPICTFTGDILSCL